MFDNTVKNVVSIGLLFSLCAPCSFASAQSFGRNGMDIPLKNSESQQNQTIDEEFLRMLQNIRIPAELLNQQPQRQPSALEQLFDVFSSHSVPNGYVIWMGNVPIRSVDDLTRTVRTHFQDPVAAFLALSEVIEAKLAMPRELSLDLSRFAIHDIYSMNDEQYIDFLRRLLRRCGAPENELELCANALFEEYKSKYPN